MIFITVGKYVNRNKNDTFSDFCGIDNINLFGVQIEENFWEAKCYVFN